MFVPADDEHTWLYDVRASADHEIDHETELAQRGERVGQAMRCRGFDGRFRSLAEFRTRPADCLFFFLMAGGAAALLLVDFVQR